MNKLTIVILMLMLTFVALSCSRNSDAEGDTTRSLADTIAAVTLRDDQIKNAGIEIGSCTVREMNKSLHVSGTIEVPPGQLISLSVPLGGYIKRMELLPGTKVHKGMLLLSLEDPQYIQVQQDYLTAKAHLEFTASDFERQYALNQDKTNSDKVFQQAKSEYTAQKVLVKSLAEKLRLLNIDPEKLNEQSLSRSINLYSPIQGYVSSVHANTGKYVSPTDVIVELVDPRHAHLSLSVFERDVPLVHEGQKVICFANANPSKEFTGTVHLVNQRINSERTVEVHCELDNADELMPGTFIQASIQVVNVKVSAVPEDAIVTWQNKPFVFTTSKDNTFIMTPVTIGITTNGFTELKTHLEVPQVAIKNAYSLLMKIKSSDNE